MTTYFRACVSVAALSLTSLLPLTAVAQIPPGAIAPAPVAVPPAVIVDQHAHQTRSQLHAILRQYPPSVADVLRLDPSLLIRQDYLAPYPALAAFLSQHPDVVRNPSFYFGEFVVRERDPRSIAIETLQGAMAGLAALLVFAGVMSVFVWLIRQVIEYRRWLRVSRAQTEAHTKLLDRLTNNEDLLAYIQSPAGRRFLESAPTPETVPQGIVSPANRILWSVQVGLVLLSLGVGLCFIKYNVVAELAEAFFVMGVVAIAIGVGFMVSAAAASVLSARLGLIRERESQS